MQITCSECGAGHPATATSSCGACGGALVPTYDEALDPGRIDAGGTLFEKYGERLPSRGTAGGIEGDTPLLRVDRLADALGIEAAVYVKDERRNPTGSFKDRALAPAVSLAAEAGETAVLTASTGNAAAACAHYAARAALDCHLLVDGGAPPLKLVEPRAYGAEVVGVEGLFEGGESALADLLGDLAARLDAYLVFAYRPFNPLLAEGVKTISYEVAEGLDWTAPDAVITATGGGDNVWAQYRGYVKLREAGLTESVPRMVAAQAAGAAPVVAGIETGADEPPALEETTTVASGIDAPFAGRHAIEAVRGSDGTAIAVDDDALLEGAAVLAEREGVWAEPASATVVPALTEFAEGGAVSADDVVVLVITGGGYKHPDPLAETLPPVRTATREPEAIEAAFGRTT